MEQILATLETLADEEALKTIERSREEVAKGEYVEWEIVRKHLGAFFRSYEVKTDLETAYSRILAVRLIVNKGRYVTLVEDLSAENASSRVAI